MRPRRRSSTRPQRGAASLQLVWTGIGLLLFGTVLVVVHGHQLLQRYAYSAALAGLGLLFLPVVLPARFSEVNGAKLWIRVGGLSVQPSEIAKILLVVFFRSLNQRGLSRRAAGARRRAAALPPVGPRIPPLVGHADGGEPQRGVAELLGTTGDRHHVRRGGPAARDRKPEAKPHGAHDASSRRPPKSISSSRSSSI